MVNIVLYIPIGSKTYPFSNLLFKERLDEVDKSFYDGRCVHNMDFLQLYGVGFLKICTKEVLVGLKASFLVVLDY